VLRAHPKRPKFLHVIVGFFNGDRSFRLPWGATLVDIAHHVEIAAQAHDGIPISVRVCCISNGTSAQLSDASRCLAAQVIADA
jgi:hypothetical protein